MCVETVFIPLHWERAQLSSPKSGDFCFKSYDFDLNNNKTGLVYVHHFFAGYFRFGMPYVFPRQAVPG